MTVRSPSLSGRLLALAGALVLGLAGCGSGNDDGAGSHASAVTTSTTSGTRTSTATTPPPPTTAAPPAYRADVTAVDAGRLPASWRAGCPVAPAALRLVTLVHWGYDGAVHTGELVVHADVADDVVTVFGTLFDARFPIERMVRIDAYDGDDDASTLANNTAAFNCRPVTGGSGWSEHAYGRAIDVNPLVNPYVRNGGTVLHPESRPYLDRRADAPGLIREGDVVVRAFGAVGWGWGGRWDATPDYQHFSASGR